MQIRILVGVACLLTAGCAVWSGPPFQTDDPEPVELHHWEVYLGSVMTHDPTGTSGTAPHLEVNNGIAPNTQLHLIVPYAVQQPPSGRALHGLGDAELGLKYRFQQEGKSCPMLGVFPLVEIPTGAAQRGLGTGHVQVILPLWAQKSWGAWTDFGGGGYGINPGAPNRNFRFVGNTIQRELNAHVTLGGELFYSTATTQDEHDRLMLDIGGQYNLNEEHHLLFSVGHSIHGEQSSLCYFAYLLTFGPSSSAEATDLIWRKP